MSMRVLLLTRYGRMGASSRVRSLQYLPFLESAGWEVDVRSLFSDGYLKALYGRRFKGFHVIFGYWNRLMVLVGARKYDLIWVEKELFPFMPATAERLLAVFAIPYVADYDDALFHRYDRNNNWVIRSVLGRKIDAVMRYAQVVIAGNDYLAERARRSGTQQVEVVPTVVDLSRYVAVSKASASPLVVGWIGSPSTTSYLTKFASAFETLVEEDDVKFVAVGANKEQLKGLPIEVQEWSEETEVQSIQSFDIGIMPLEDSPWERGKCGYKLIQYMACGLPVVASPVGANRQIVDHGVNGFFAEDKQEWVDALRLLVRDRTLRRRMGAKGRKRAESTYSLQVQADRLETILRSASPQL